MTPITYKPNPSCEGGMEVHRYGRYVSLKEYEKLKAEIERLRKAGDGMEEVIWLNGCLSGMQIKERAVKVWNATKEGKPQS